MYLGDGDPGVPEAPFFAWNRLCAMYCKLAEKIGAGQGDQN